MTNARWSLAAITTFGIRAVFSVGCSAYFLGSTPYAEAQYSLIHLGTATSGYGEDVAVAGNYAFVASYAGGLRVFDISDRLNPAFVAATNSGIPYVYDLNITIAGGYAYTGAIRDTDFHVYDISTPTQPLPGTNVFSGNYVAEIVVRGAIGYVANTAAGFSVYDFSDPSMPLRVTNFTGTSASCVTMAGQYAYIGGGSLIRVYNLTNPLAPVEVGSANSPSCTAIAVVDHYAYLAHAGGITIFDVDNPSSPVKVGPGLSIGRVEDLIISGHYLFAANWAAGVRMYDLSNPSQPLEIAHVNTTGYAPASQGLFLAGNYLYVASGNTGFYVCAIVPRLQVVLDDANHPWISWPEPFALGLTVERSDTLSPGLWTSINGDPIRTNGYCWLKPEGGYFGFFRLSMSP